MGFSIPSVKVPSPRDIYNGAKDKVEDLADGAKDKVSDIADEVSDLPDKARERATDFVDRRKSDVTDFVSDSREFVSNQAESGRNFFDSTRDFITDKANDARDYVGDRKDDAIDYATDKVEQGKDYVVDKAEDAYDYTTDKIEQGKDYVVDKAEDAYDYTTDKIEQGKDYVVDKAEDAYDYTTDKIEQGKDYVVDKVEQGADVVVDKATEFADAFTDQTTITDEDVQSLKPGDSVSLDAKAEGGGGVVVGAETGITVSLDDQGVYTVTQDGGAKVGVGIKDAGEAGGQLGGTREYQFDNPEDAARAAQIIQKQTILAGTSGVTSPPFIPNPVAVQYIWSGDAQADQDFLDDHTSKLEVGPGAYGKVGVPKVGIEVDGLAERLDGNGDGSGALGGVEAQVSVDNNYSFEYENGERTAAVANTEITVSGNIDLDGLNLTNPLPQEFQEADIEATFQIEQRTSLETGIDEFTITATLTAEGQDQKAYTIELSGSVSSDKIDDIAKDLLKGDIGTITRNTELQGDYYESDIDRSGFDLGFLVGEVGAGKEFQTVDEDSRRSVSF